MPTGNRRLHGELGSTKPSRPKRSSHNPFRLAQFHQPYDQDDRKSMVIRYYTDAHVSRESADQGALQQKYRRSDSSGIGSPVRVLRQQHAIEASSTELKHSRYTKGHKSSKLGSRRRRASVADRRSTDTGSTRQLETKPSKSAKLRKRLSMHRPLNQSLEPVQIADTDQPPPNKGRRIGGKQWNQSPAQKQLYEEQQKKLVGLTELKRVSKGSPSNRQRRGSKDSRSSVENVNRQRRSSVNNRWNPKYDRLSSFDIPWAYKLLDIMSISKVSELPLLYGMLMEIPEYQAVATDPFMIWMASLFPTEPVRNNDGKLVISSAVYNRLTGINEPSTMHVTRHVLTRISSNSRSSNKPRRGLSELLDRIPWFGPVNRLIDIVRHATLSDLYDIRHILRNEISKVDSEFSKAIELFVSDEKLIHHQGIREADYKREERIISLKSNVELYPKTAMYVIDSVLKHIDLKTPSVRNSDVSMFKDTSAKIYWLPTESNHRRHTASHQQHLKLQRLNQDNRLDSSSPKAVRIESPYWAVSYGND